MKNRKVGMWVGVVAAMLVLTVGVGTASATITADSTTWEGFYEADTQPVASGWQDVGGGNANTTVIPDGANNYINHQATAGYEGYKYIKNPGTLDPQTNGGITLEFRNRVRTGQFLMHFWPSSVDDGRWLTIYESDSNMTIRDADQAPSGIANTNGTNEWTTFRITCDDTDWKVYRDTDQSVQASIPVVSDSGAYGLYQMAAYAIYGTEDFDLDYMRWTDAGAMVIPEPATMGLLVLGGLLGLRRRR